jgi:hypothetical protein
MSVNSSPTASQKNMKKLPISKIFSFIAGVEYFVKILNGSHGILRGPRETD